MSEQTTAQPEQKEIILCTTRLHLEEVGFFTGFTPDLDKYAALFNDPAKHFWITRDKQKVEKEPAIKQWIPYSFIIKRTEDGPMILRYARTKGGNEDRLKTKSSACAGGHVNPIVGADGLPFSGYQLLHLSCANELVQEFKFQRRSFTFDFEHVATREQLVAVGLVNNEDEVGAVHLGLVMALVIGPDVEVESGEPEKIQFEGWMTPEEFQNLKPDPEFEPWTAILQEHTDYIVNTALGFKKGRRVVVRGGTYDGVKGTLDLFGIQGGEDLDGKPLPEIWSAIVIRDGGGAVGPVRVTNLFVDYQHEMLEKVKEAGEVVSQEPSRIIIP